MTTVSLHNLTKHYDSVAAVDDLSLAVNSGELVALLGPSGCGKTTTLRMIAGLLDPTAGDIRFGERSVVNVAPERRGTTMVFQQGLLFPHMTVAENVGFGLKMRRVPRRERQAQVEAMLARVQLPQMGPRRVSQLSGGQQQRIALARALIIEPEVLLLDEPLANLDANLRLDMRQLIRDIQREMKITAIFVTHDQEEAVMLADRVALMMEGRLLQVGPPQDFYARPQSATVARFFRNENFLPGMKRGDAVETNVGTLCIAPQPQPDGPVWLTVRPERVQIGSEFAQNCVPAVVVNSVYMGTYAQIEVELDGRRWQVQAESETLPAPGEVLPLALPPKSIWLVPPETT